MPDGEVTTRLDTIEQGLSRIEQVLGLQRARTAMLEDEDLAGITNSTNSGSCMNSSVSAGCHCVEEAETA